MSRAEIKILGVRGPDRQNAGGLALDALSQIDSPQRIHSEPFRNLSIVLNVPIAPLRIHAARSQLRQSVPIGVMRNVSGQPTRSQR